MPPLLLGRFFNFVSSLFHDERPWELGWVFMWLSLSAESVEQARDYEVAIVFMRRVRDEINNGQRRLDNLVHVSLPLAL